MLLDFGFNKQFRLRNSNDFKEVLCSPDFKLFQKSFIILAHKKLDRSSPQLGIIIPKKRVSSAVGRNFYRRVIRESFRMNKRMLEGTKLVFMARSGLQYLSADELRGQLMSHWKRCFKLNKKQ